MAEQHCPDGQKPFVQETEAGVSVWKGLQLHITKWKPLALPPKALLYISHGVAEHMGRYQLLAEHLSSAGILVFGHDHVGHGRSEGDRVHVDDYDIYVQDIIQTVMSMKKCFPDIPCILMGHSMGGLIAGLTAVNSQDLFAGLILSSALVEIDPKTAGWFFQTLTKVLAVISPGFGVKKVNTDDISSIVEEVQAYKDDQFNYHGEVKAKWGSETMKAIEKLRQSLKEIRLPLLIIHGTDDNIVPISGTDYIIANVSSVQVQFEKFERNRHEVFHDVDQDAAREIVKKWVCEFFAD